MRHIFEELNVGIRQTMNEKPALTTGVTAGIIVVAIAIIVWQSMGKSGPSTSIPTKAFFSDDDGKTWFVDDVTKIPPFDHNGKPAFRVKLFRCGDNGKPFVGHLEGFNEEGKQKLEEMVKSGGGAAAVGGAQRMSIANGMMVKRPTDMVWVQSNPGDPESFQEFNKIMQPVCPDGTMEGLRIVNPGDKDALP